MQEARTIFAGVPSMGDEPKGKVSHSHAQMTFLTSLDLVIKILQYFQQYLQLSGRLLLVLMFMTLIHFDFNSRNVSNLRKSLYWSCLMDHSVCHIIWII